MAIVLAPLVVALVGALVYAFAQGKVGELGRLAFFVGLFWLVYLLGGRSVHLL